MNDELCQLKIPVMIQERFLVTIAICILPASFTVVIDRVT